MLNTSRGEQVSLAEKKPVTQSGSGAETRRLAPGGPWQAETGRSLPS